MAVAASRQNQRLVWGIHHCHKHRWQRTHRTHHARECSEHAHQVFEPVDVAGRDAVSCGEKFAPLFFRRSPLFRAARPTGETAAAAATAVVSWYTPLEFLEAAVPVGGTARVGRRR